MKMREDFRNQTKNSDNFCLNLIFIFIASTSTFNWGFFIFLQKSDFVFFIHSMRT